MWEILDSENLRNLVNDAQFDKFSPTIFVNTVKLLKICHQICNREYHVTLTIYTLCCDCGSSSLLFPVVVCCNHNIDNT